MKRVPIIPAAFVLFTACTPPVQPAPGPRPAAATPADSLPPGVAAARAAYVRGWNEGNRAALAVLFAEDAEVVFRDYTLHGRAQIDGRWLADDVGRVSDLVMTLARVARSGDEVAESGSVTLAFRRAGGDTGRERGSYEHVWARRPDGGWTLRTVRMDTHPVAPCPLLRGSASLREMQLTQLHNSGIRRLRAGEHAARR